MKKILALALTLCLFEPVVAFSQAQAPAAAQTQAPVQTQTPARIRAQSELVVVPVTVKDGSGRLVPGLERNDFRMFEDGAEQDVSLFSAEPFPLSAVVLLDNNLPTKELNQVQDSLVSISAGFGPSDEVALMTFDQFPEQVMPLTANNDQLFTQLKRTKLGSTFSLPSSPPFTTSVPEVNGRPVTGGGVSVPNASTGIRGKNIEDAIHEAAQLLKGRGRDRRKLIFLVSDGNNAKDNKWNYTANLELLLSSDISVYAVVVGTNYLHIERNILPKYADATGGDSYYASKEKDLDRLYSNLTEQARNQYTLAYAPHRAGKSHDYHSVEVRVRRPGLKVYARQGYYTGVAR
jgi:Ca-activated chloride channel family protein